MTARILTIDFTKSFIEELALYIHREYTAQGRSLERLAVVFGGKRPAHFLKRALSSKIGKPFLPPVCYAIDDFIEELSGSSGKPLSSDLEDRFDIYTLAKELAPELLQGRETFAAFLPWAGDIVNFIGQLDLEDVSVSHLKNVEASARIGYPVPESINRMLAKVLLLRTAFHERLLSRGRMSRGLRYLKARQNAAVWDSGRFNEIIFANFFYFHKTEEAVVKTLYSAGKATLFFQGDQRKWPVLQRIAERFECELKEGARPTPTAFDLKVYSAFDVHSEAAVVRDILKTVPDLARTVVVLPDTGALVPLLSAFPDEVKDLNVSMGYPLKRGSLYLLMDAVFRAQLSRKNARYYSRDYLAVLQHPFVKNLRLSSESAVTRVLVHKVEEVLKGRISGDISGRLFVSLEDVDHEGVILIEALRTLSGMGISISEKELGGVLRDMHACLFHAFEAVRDLSLFSRSLRALLDMMSRKSFMHRYPLNVNIAGRMYELVDELEASSFSKETFKPEEIFRIFEERIAPELVNFSGTPLKGLQVLGLFETRSLNFDHVIMMDVNEGFLPKIDVRASLIPREVMSRLQLDRLELEEEIQRYQFMRIISSAKTVHLVYQKNKEHEPSRFLEELVWEDQKREVSLKPYRTLLAGFPVSVDVRERQGLKTPEIMAFLKNFTYSASSINAYMANPYTFYTNYVLGLREEDDSLDEPDAAVVGNFMHHFLEEVYQPLQNKAPLFDEAFEETLWRIFERRFNHDFTRRMRSDAFLIKGVMEHKLRVFLGYERERAAAVARIISVEQEFKGTLDLSVGRMKFKAKVDRIEESVDGKLLVLDYKTGSTDKLPRPSFFFDEEEWRFSGETLREYLFDHVRSFQLPLYLYFVAQSFPERPVNAGLYSLRDPGINKLFKDDKPLPGMSVFWEPYAKALDALFKELMDPSVAFMDDELRNTDF